MMTEKDSNKINFFRLLGLEAITPENDSSKILENHVSKISNQYTNLFQKNNSIKTGYENFCIKKGTKQLFPFKDFDFIGKHVVCQKCCQKFASKLSYRAHVGTDICIKTFNGPNLIYLKYKNRSGRQGRKKNKSKPLDDLLVHDIKKNLLNPEMLNTLQTRNNCYSDNVLQRVKVKQGNNSIKNDEPHVKKPRGRPRKHIEFVPIKKKVTPKELASEIVNNPSQNDSILSNSSEMNETDLKEKKKDFVMSSDNGYKSCNNNASEAIKQELNDRMKILTDKFCKLADAEWKFGRKPEEFQSSTGREGKTAELTVKEYEICVTINELKQEILALSQQFRGRDEFCFNDQLESMLSKLNEKRDDFVRGKVIKTDITNVPTVNKGKENIQCALQKNEDENKIIINVSNVDFEKNDKNDEVWLHNDSRDSISAILNDGCDSIECHEVDDIMGEPMSKDSFEENVETVTIDMISNCNNSVSNNHVNNIDLNFPLNPGLDCRICGKNFASIAEWKMHRSEHLAKVNKKFLCKICGLKFKVYDNFMKHVSTHGKTEQKNVDNTHYKSLKCKLCNKQYNYLQSYYAHIKTHK